MGQDSEPESKSWWKTLPGLLTAIAATITAVTGFIVAVHQAGFFNRSSQPASQSQSESAETKQSTGNSASRPIIIPANTEIHSADSLYKLLSARLAPYSPGQTSLHVTVQMTNQGRFDSNLYAASFRLLVNGNLQPPVNDPDEIVAAQSAKQVDLEFVIPADTTSVSLQMGNVGEGAPAIPIALPPLPRQ
jgi:hypothetical protein